MYTYIRVYMRIYIYIYTYRTLYINIFMYFQRSKHPQILDLFLVFSKALIHVKYEL